MSRTIILTAFMALAAASCTSYYGMTAAPAKAKADDPSGRASGRDLESAVAETKSREAANPGEDPKPKPEPARPAFASATYDPQPGIVGTVVAVVNGDIITKEEALRDARPALDALEKDESLTELGRETRRREIIGGVLMLKVERLLALQEAKRAITTEEAERIEADADSVVKNAVRHAGTVTRMEAMLAQKGRTMETQRQAEIDNRRIRALLSREIDAKVDVTPGEMQRYFAEHRKELDGKAKATVREIFISFAKHPAKEEAQALAASLRARVAKGEDFAALARDNSDGPNAKDGGLWEPAVEGGGTFRPEVERAAFALEANEVSGVVMSEIGAHVLRAEEVQPARSVSFSEVQDDILTKLRNQKSDDLYRKLIRKLWDRSYVDIRWK